jgi:hypothetical protein
MVCLQGENALFLPASFLSLADKFLPWISSLRNPWVCFEAEDQTGSSAVDAAGKIASGVWTPFLTSTEDWGAASQMVNGCAAHSSRRWLTCHLLSHQFDIDIDGRSEMRSGFS